MRNLDLLALTDLLHCDKRVSLRSALHVGLLHKMLLEKEVPQLKKAGGGASPVLYGETILV